MRAVAVLGVFLFHLGFDAVPGGFVGVDVFYVISGFVIFRTMYRDLDEQSFSPWAFYCRRIRRIMPALLVTLTGCTIAGAVLMLPEDFLRMANSGLATLLSGANIYFFDRIDYFAPSVRETPLAHMWSLGIEEQFYLLAPLLAFAVTRFRSSKGLACALGIVSLLSLLENLIAVYGFRNELHAFYLPMARFWEIGAGGLLAWLEPRWRPKGGVRLALALLGGVGLFASFLVIEETMMFPGAVALLPVAATSAIIVAKISPTDPFGRTIAAAPVLFVGRISYSLYLFHWPLIVFYSLYGDPALSTVEKIGLLVAGLTLAWLNWHFVESRFRRAHLGGRRELRIAGAAASVGIIMLAVSLGDGIPARLSPTAQAVAAEIALVTVHPKGCEAIARLPSHRSGHLCTYTDRKEGFGYLLWGDSHARVLGKGLQQLVRVPGLVLDMSACPALLDTDQAGSSYRDNCRANQDRALELVRTEHIPVVVLASRWASYGSPIGALNDGRLPPKLLDRTTGSEISIADALAHTVQQFRDAGALVVILGPVPEAPFDVPKAMIRAAHLKTPAPRIDREQFNLRQRDVLPALAALADPPGVVVVWPHERLCDGVQCRFADGNTPLYADDDHLSLQGTLIAAGGVAEAITAMLAKVPTQN